MMSLNLLLEPLIQEIKVVTNVFRIEEVVEDGDEG